MPDEIDPALAAAIEKLAHELGDLPEPTDAAARLDWIVDILIQRKHLTENHRPMIKRIRARRKPLITYGSGDTSAPDPDIDCASRIPLCHARCCSFTVSLTPDEIRAGQVPWSLDEPYKLPKHDDTGYCCNLGRTGGCAKYDARPGTCRKYDCRSDPRVWIDFEQRIPAPMPAGVIPLPDWPSDED